MGKRERETHSFVEELMNTFFEFTQNRSTRCLIPISGKGR